MGEGVEGVVKKLREIASPLREAGGRLQREARLLEREWRVVEDVPLPPLEVEVGVVDVPCHRDFFDFPLRLLVEGVGQTRKAVLRVRACERTVRILLILLPLDWRECGVLHRGRTSLRDLLRLAILERLNPGLLDRIVEAVRGGAERYVEVLEKLRSAAALLEMVMK